MRTVAESLADRVRAVTDIEKPDDPVRRQEILIRLSGGTVSRRREVNRVEYGFADLDRRKMYDEPTQDYRKGQATRIVGCRCLRRAYNMTLENARELFALLDVPEDLRTLLDSNFTKHTAGGEVLFTQASLRQF